MPKQTRSTAEAVNLLLQMYWVLNKFESFTGSEDVGSNFLSVSQKFGELDAGPAATARFHKGNVSTSTVAYKAEYVRTLTRIDD